jgi:TetR/AcrR family transcriptional regulator, regulator of cefoperazone and chloramphenicol sensitivity
VVPPTTTKPSDRDAGDLTARARIRNAALGLFTEHGVRRTSIRAIARAAGVSSGLVQHHFGTKEALRAACDDYVLSQLVGLKEELVVGGRLDSPAFLAERHPELVQWYRYLARSMIDGSSAAESMFGQMVAATEAWLATHHPGLVADAHGYAVVLVGMEIGLLAMHGQLSDALGADVLSPEGHLRLARAKVEFYSTPLLDASLAHQARDSIDAVLGRDAPAGSPSRGDGGDLRDGHDGRERRERREPRRRSP